MKQTIIYKLKPTKEQEGHLHNLCSIATKLYNTANYQRRQEWEKTGKIPNYNIQDKILKNNVWYKLLPSQTAQAVLENLDRNYKSWFKLRKKDKSNNPPGFRKKETLSVITIKQCFKIINNKIIISISKKYKEEKGIKSLEIEYSKWKESIGKAKMCQILIKKGRWYATIIYETIEPPIQLNDKVMAIDLGIINIASCVTNKGFSEIYPGKGLLAVQHYFNSRKARVQSRLNKQFPKKHKSKTLNNLNQKQTRQINQLLHTISKNIINRAKELDIKTLVVGDLKDIRKDANHGKRNNQKLHSWSFSKITQQLEYKSTLAGIRFVRVNEMNTSKTCSCCGVIRKANRIKRGLYKCKICGRIQNADLNGASNILKKYLQLFDIKDRSIGNVGVPLIERIRNVIPLSQEANDFNH